jgi:hypothetical protein
MAAEQHAHTKVREHLLQEYLRTNALARLSGFVAPKTFEPKDILAYAIQAFLSLIDVFSLVIYGCFSILVILFITIAWLGLQTLPDARLLTLQILALTLGYMGYVYVWNRRQSRVVQWYRVMRALAVGLSGSMLLVFQVAGFSHQQEVLSSTLNLGLGGALLFMLMPLALFGSLLGYVNLSLIYRGVIKNFQQMGLASLLALPIGLLIMGLPTVLLLHSLSTQFWTPDRLIILGFIGQYYTYIFAALEPVIKVIRR